MGVATKWEEAKAALDKALQELEQAQAAFNAASTAEREAWEALETLAGRVTAQEVPATEGQKRFWPRAEPVAEGAAGFTVQPSHGKLIG